MLSPASEPRAPIEDRLIEALQPVRGFVLAAAIHHLFASGLFDSLASGSCSLAELAARHDVIEDRAAALLDYLGNEGVVDARDARYALTAKGRGLAEFRGWYTMLIGGYGSTFLQLGDKLVRGSGSATRRADQVGIGSCAISHHDAIPLTRRLMANIPHPVRRIVDLGCGNGLYLVEFCRLLPELEAWGIEPDPAGYEAAVALVRQHGLTSRVQLACCTALAFFERTLAADPDLCVLGFVLHEVLGQSGRAAVVEFLVGLTRRYPRIHLIVIEVDQQMRNRSIMRHGLSLAYYNPYYLFHPFTEQRLETTAFWEQLFHDAGLAIVARDTVTPDVDSTGLEVGFLLRPLA